MKKLMMAVAIVCTAVATQAASVSWASGRIFTAASTDGGFSSTGIKAAATAYLFTITASDYEGFLADYNSNGDMSSVWNAYKDNLASATATGPTKSLTNTSSLTTSADIDETVYGAIIYFYHDDALDQDFYIANIASGTVGAESGLNISNLGNYYLGDSTGKTTGGWQAVPEPTSAMLLVLGVAALALRRRQK